VPWTQADLDAIDAAILAAAKQGGGSVQFGDRSVSYNLKELRALRAVIAGEIEILASGSGTRYAATSKGTGGPTVSSSRRWWW
jgi:hypothetical protein